MKKIILLFLSAFFISAAYSQWCVTTYQAGGQGITTQGANITVLEIATNGDVWFNLVYGAGQGFGLGKKSGDAWIAFYAGTDIQYNLHQVVNAIAFDKQDSIWVGTENGLAQFNGTNTTGWRIFKTPVITGNKVTALRIDRNNKKWVGLGNGDIMTLEGNTWTTYNQYHNGGQINDIDTAMDGSVWIAKNGKPGVAKYKQGTWTPFNQFENIRYITTDQLGRILVPSDDSLMIIFNDSIVSTTKADPNLDATLFDVAVGPYGRVWVSSNKGLLLKAGDSFRRYTKSNSPLPASFASPIPLKFDKLGNLWFSYYYTASNTYPGFGYVYRTINQATAIAIKNKPSPAFCYGDSIVLDANVVSNTYIWSDGTAGRTTTFYDNADVNVAYEGDNNCYYYDTVKVIAQHVYENEKPCVVTVSNDNKNLLVWEKTPDVGTASYNVYRQVTTDSFKFITNIPAGNLSVFRDQEADPRKKSFKYKISSVDTCGNESGKSFYHKTMHLQISLGMDTTEVQLAWQNYEGFSFPYYIIYKGTSPDNLFPIDTIPWDNTNLTFNDFPVIGRHYYRVGVVLPFMCFPTGDEKADSGPYSHSMSNIEDNRLQDTGSTYIEPLPSEIRSYPNPFTYWTQIDFENPLKYPYELRVTDMSGKLVRMIGDIRDNKVVFLRDGLPKGFYLFELKGDIVYKGKFIIR